MSSDVLNIVHIVSTYPPYRGGMGNVCHEIVKRQRKRGHEVTVLTPSTHRPWLRWGNAALMPQLLWKLRGFDVVHLHWPFIGGAEWVLLHFFCLRTYSDVLENIRIRNRTSRVTPNLVVTYHMDLVGSEVLAVFFKVYQWLMVQLMLRISTFVTVASLDYAEHSRWLRGRKYLVEVPYGVDGGRFAPREFFLRSDSGQASSNNMVRQAHHIYSSSEGPPIAIGGPESRSTDVPIALFVSALDRAHYFKGLDILLQAWKELGATGKRARLRIVGDGDQRAHYEQIGRGLASTNCGQVEFVGAVPWKELPDVYRSADFLVFPSIDASEAFGLVILEAAASGLPAIVSNLPGVRTLLKEGETGLLVPPRDVHALALALRKFIMDPEVLAVMGKAARDRAVQNYSWDATADAIEWTYWLKSNPIDKLALVSIKDRKVLMAKSRGHKAWFIPGGKRDVGESDREALLREVHEELGVTLDPSSIRYFGSYTAQANDKPVGISVRGRCYIAGFDGQPRPCNEIEAIEYMNFSQRAAVGNIAKLLFDDLKKRDLID